MKKLPMIMPLVILLCLAVNLCAFPFESASLHAKEWTSEQKAAAECFHKYVDTSIKGDIEKLKSFYHPEMSWWDYKQEHPIGIDVFLKGREDLYKSEVKWVSFDAKPLEIHVVGNVAILYATYTNLLKDPEGNETTTSGRWTAVLIKQEEKWLFLSNSYSEI
jgi:ketosteroid isomerase-like protein